MESNKIHCRINPDPKCTPVYSDPENLMTYRNLRERQIYFPPCSLNLGASNYVVHVCSKFLETIDIFVDSISVSKLPLEPLIDMQNSPLGFCQEASSSFKPFLKNPIIPPSVEAHNIIL